MIVFFILTIYINLFITDILSTQENNFKMEIDNEMDNLSRLLIFAVVAISYIYQIVNNNYHELYYNNSYIYINTNNVITQSRMNMNLNK